MAGGFFQDNLNAVTDALEEQASDAADRAEVAQAAAETAEANAETAQAAAETAQTGAEGFKNQASTHANGALTYLNLAVTAKNQASQWALLAGDARTDAETAQTAAETAETNAETAESNASASETAADNSRSDAAKLATNPEDGQYTLSDGVTSGYSALHYNAKALASKTAAETAETAASGSAQAAAASETAAGSSEANAAASETAAASSATNAAGSASAASSSETNAAASELAASNSATAASGSATAAAGSATAASGSATTATNQATAASNSATAASGSATAAANSATAAASSATDASTAKTAAETAKTAAETAKTAAESAQTATENIFDQFGDQYLGSKASDPTTDNDGDALNDGDVYWNTTDSTLRFYTGTAWVAPETVASTAATNAGTSATAAAGSATAASGSATAASGSATAAANSATAAATSETNAGTSETNAGNSATAAAASAGNASTSETNAAGSATAAATSASNASTSATAAAGSATAASASKTAAAGSATAAATSATNAATSASNAATSETNAATSETNAATSATNAATSSTTAAANASLASAYKTSAASSALTAANEATYAANSATAAATSESNAATSESNASSSAQTAGLMAQGATNASTAAGNSATAAATSASDAATAKTAAETAKTAAESAQSATETLFDNFGDQYLGSKTSDPTTDNDGDALNAGDIYWNSTNNTLRFYTGSAWVAPETVATTAASNAQTSATNASNSATAASTSASNAATSESNASGSAVSAATSASNASTSASNASTSASSASTSASNASSSATSAANSATAAAASFDSFDDRYLGAKSSAPTVDNDGNALLTGALYWNSTSNTLNTWTGSAWARSLTQADEGSGNGLDADQLDGNHGSYYQNASNLTSGTLPYNRISSVLGYYTADHLIPTGDRSSLSSPTLSMAAMVDPAVENKMQFAVPDVIEGSTDGGSTWTDITSNYSTNDLKDMMSGTGTSGGITITSDQYDKIRIYWNHSQYNYGYVYLNYLHIYQSGRSNTATIQIERKDYTNQTWSTVDTTGSHGGWPTHVWIPHSAIPYTASSGRNDSVRITYDFTWSTSNVQSFTINKINWYGTYPVAEHNRVTTWDRDGNFQVQNNLLVNGTIEGNSSLTMKADGFSFKNSADTETMLAATQNGAVSLYYDNAQKLATSSSGVSVTGGVTTTDLIHADEAYVQASQGSDYTTLQFNGVGFGRATSYLIPTSTDTHSLYIGGYSQDQNDWVNIKIWGTNSTSLQFNGGQVWHAGNDGSGSGLDADKIDGYNVSVVSALPGTPDANTIYYIT